MKTTKKQFDLFRSECQRLTKKWGLVGWRIEYIWDGEDRKERASIGVGLSGRVVTFYFPKDWHDDIKPTDQVIIESARHEVCHLLSARLRSLAVQRFTSEDEIYEANEELARLIDNAVKEGYQGLERKV